MKDIILKMLDVQSALNDKTLPGWTQNPPKYLLAIAQECAEGIDHLGWKWWAKQTPDLKAAQMEVIDIFHFAMSEYLVDFAPAVCANLILNGYEGKDTPYVSFNSRSFKIERMSEIELFGLIAAMAHSEDLDFRVIWALCDRLGMSFEHTVRLYFTKAVLNQFRQDHGYKDGTYRKRWDGISEDNEYAASIASHIHWDTASAPTVFYDWLKERYESLAPTVAKEPKA